VSGYTWGGMASVVPQSVEPDAEAEKVAGEIEELGMERHEGWGARREARWRSLLSRLAVHRSSRYALLGCPGFIDKERLAQLVEEAQTQRGDASFIEGQVGQAGQGHGMPGPVARRLAVDRGWRRLLEPTLGGGPRLPCTAGYLYYERPGARISPHVDYPNFAINILVLLEHEWPPGATGSALVVHPAGNPPVRVNLAAGEAIALEAYGLVHEREAMCEGERLTMLTLGYGGLAEPEAK
jgi:hypothetical protein